VDSVLSASAATEGSEGRWHWRPAARGLEEGGRGAS
jgi:hypothetical protein